MSSLIHYLRPLRGELVQIERSGPEACQGWLFAIQDDYLTLRADNGDDLHLPLHHIRSVTRLPPPADGRPRLPSEPALAETFAALLQTNPGRSVRLYHAGPEVTFGTLRECDTDHLIIKANTGELVCFPLFHIRSLYFMADQPGTGAQAAESEDGR